MSYNVINLEDLYNSKGEKDTRNLFEDFECPLNKDVEYFIKNKAIEKGLRFAIREGGRTVGSGVVADIVE